MKFLLQIARYLNEYSQDLVYSLKFNTPRSPEEQNRRLFYRIVTLAHAIEKGLSLPNVRPFFGRDKIINIQKFIDEYDPSFSAFPLEMAHGALVSYLKVHSAEEDPDGFLLNLSTYCENGKFKGIESRGGVKEYRLPPASEAATIETYQRFLTSRFSCRNYRDELVSPELLARIIACAQAAPSQCNRQSSRVHCYQGKQDIERLLELQAGSGGFHRSVYNLFVVTSESTAWGGAGQRNQCYVDGALFAQTLMLSCHAHGVFTCPLNLAIGNRRERQIKSVAGIPSRERLVMMIAFGFSDHHQAKFASSPRLRVGEVLTVH